jgi:hypothetical protein
MSDFRRSRDPPRPQVKTIRAFTLPSEAVARGDCKSTSKEVAVSKLTKIASRPPCRERDDANHVLELNVCEPLPRGDPSDATPSRHLPHGLDGNMLIMLRRHVLRLGAIANRPHVPPRAAFLINGIPATVPCVLAAAVGSYKK